MNSIDPAISVRGLSKAYTIFHDQEDHSTLAEALLARMKNPLKRQKSETFWALRDVNFEMKKGEVLGIIGRNGAGKSTLLKILSRITEPTDGEIRLYGRIGSLLEVGTGFHPELTGRENVFLNGAILGMRRWEIQKYFDAIVEFAGVSQFLDTPVKRYSSGMYVRLAFAVAAHLASEILVVDEVLAVGDVEFQKKCLGKMKDVAQSGRTVLFVSHQMQAISTLCTQVIYMQNGQIDFQGDVTEGISRYLNSRKLPGAARSRPRRAASPDLKFTSITSDKNVYLSTDPIAIDIDISAQTDKFPSYWISLEIANSMGITVLHLDSRLLNMEFPAVGQRTVRFTIRDARLAQGDYIVNAYLCTATTIADRFDEAMEFTIAPILPYPGSRNDCARRAIVYPRLQIEDLSAGPAATESAPQETATVQLGP
ncbi:MAG: ABC transporter ATP-binding protein [Tepidisphaeraceae bacterium]|jgi:lipopolysaccharide transport system ATP-binding protein